MNGSTYLLEATRQFQSLKDLADRALAQVPDAQFFATIGEETNALALIVKHMAGNLRSRWTDFLTTDGEKPDRDRDTEFEQLKADSRGSLMARWEHGWGILFATLRSLEGSDLERTVTIRGEPHTVFRAIQRQVSHYGYHVGQIVLLSRHWVGPSWQTLSVPKGQSAEYEREMRGRHAP